MSNYTKTTNFATKDSLPSGNANKIVKGTEIDTEFNNIATAVATKADTAGPTFTGTVTIPTADINGGAIDGTTIGAASASSIVGTTIVANTSINIAGDGATVTGIKDEDDMSSNSATKLATQQSIKAYVDSQLTAQDLDVTDGSSSIDIDLDSESLGILGGTGIDSTASGTGVTLAIDSTVATLTGSQTLTNKTLTAPTLTGTAVVASLDISGDVDVDGTLETDALSINSTTVTSTAAELNILDGVTATASELNILDGVTSTTAELNILDGVTSTTAELNILDGVTATASELNIMDGVTASTAELNIMDGVTSTTAELNILDGVTSTAAELNILDGKAFLDEDDMSSNSATGIASQQSIKAYVDAQITAEDLDFQADSGGALSIDLDSETLTFTGGTGIDTSGSGNAVTFAIDSTVATLTGTQTLTNKTLTSPDINTPDIDGGTIDNTVIGGTTAAAGTFTTFTSNGIDDNADATAITIDSSERVGIGGSPSHELDVISTTSGTSRTIRVASTASSGDNDATMIISNGGSGDAMLRFDYEGSNTDRARIGVSSSAQQLEFYTAGNNERMRIDSSGNVGIGTDSPQAAKFSTTASGILEVAGTKPVLNIHETDVADAELFMGMSGGTALLGTTGDGILRFLTGTSSASEAMRINSSGNVGIGVVPETHHSGVDALQIGLGASLVGNTTNPSRTYLNANAYINSSNVESYVQTDEASQYFQNAGTHTFKVAPSGSADSAIGWTTAMTIDNSGNVGIGTDDPKSTLEVKGTFGAPATSGFAAGFIQRFSQTSGVGSLDVGFGDPYSWLQSRASNNYATNFALALNPNGGNVGIGVTPSAWSGFSGVAQVHNSALASVNNGAYLYANAYYDGSNNRYIATDEASRYYQLGGNHVWETAASATAGSVVSFSESMRIDTSGNVIVGKSVTSSTTAGTVLYQNGQIYASANGSQAMVLTRITDDGPILIFNKDSGEFGRISCRSSGANLQISSAQSGIDFGGDGYLPMRGTNIVDNDLDIGSSSFRYDDIFATNGTIQTSDRNEKQDIEALSDAEQRVAVAAKGLLRKYRYKSAVEEKGDDARIHFGIIAQDLQDAFTAEGLDAARYGMFCSDTWTDEETGEERTRLGVRYSELLAFIISAI